MRAHFIPEQVTWKVPIKNVRMSEYWQFAGRCKRPKRKPTVIIRHGAEGQSVQWEDQRFAFTNGDEKTLELLAANVCQLCGI